MSHPVFGRRREAAEDRASGGRASGGLGLALAALVAAAASLSSCAYNSVFLEDARLEFSLADDSPLVGKVLELRFASLDGVSSSEGFTRRFNLVADENSCVWEMAEYGAYEKSPLEGSRVALGYRFREAPAGDYLDDGERSLEFFLPGKGNEARDSAAQSCELRMPDGGTLTAAFRARYYFGMVY